ncbi:bll7994 [Bradyrhizobium diazoefficiens USDA 110]|uniref:Bll7994 protein n=1 Tax=Bradyrhizobium diazoefficiens (strain JCM 10833 / BCRC 13528 / IAM 13628 / NBRC 14792 / USDA 110) TaxID=224911 RepID=Q89C04_BRADU|nr:hypothetical protein CO678_37540 [Bradyrhizobium diazoefficiens]QBP26718.1 hypothetical protein Bdiaspc4_42270 [Bradyrhizobium diazoefficiens]BAC53259.1 bll7994 [Bradyrhizobium diazoefficiens USDA 110]
MARRVMRRAQGRSRRRASLRCERLQNHKEFQLCRSSWLGSGWRGRPVLICEPGPVSAGQHRLFEQISTALIPIEVSSIRRRSGGRLTAGRPSRPAETEKPAAAVLPPRERARSLLLFVAHVVRRRSGAARVVMATGRAVLRNADRLLLAHVVGDLGLRTTAVMMAVLFLVGGLRHRRHRQQGNDADRSQELLRDHVRSPGLWTRHHEAQPGFPL